MTTTDCPICGAQPGQSCITTLGRSCKDHGARTRRAKRPQPDLVEQLTLTARVEAPDPVPPRAVSPIAVEPAVQLAFVVLVDYLEKRLSQ
jgi:hypothetical protein